MARICEISNCEYNHLAKGYCSKHYYRQKRGLSVTGRTRFDRRPAIVKRGYALLELANGRGFTKVNLQHKDLEKHNWSLDGRGYACTYKDGRVVKLHHLVMGKPPEGKVTDHKNQDKLDNRSRNLRFVSWSENNRNKTLPSPAPA